jgi:signal peptidase II
MTNYHQSQSESTVPEADNHSKIMKHLRILLLATMVLSLLLDQLSKFWLSSHLTIHRPIEIFGNYVRLYLTRNPYLIWGIPIKSNLVYFFLPTIGIIFVAYIGLKTKVKFSAIAYGLLIGGAIGNLIDRIRLSYVIDFIDMGIKDNRWPTYNIADSAIFIGLVMIIAREIFKPNPKTIEYPNA